MTEINPEYLQERWGVGEPRSSFSVLHLTSDEEIPASNVEEILSWDAIESSGGAKTFADIDAHPTTFVIPVGVTHVKIKASAAVVSATTTVTSYLSLRKNGVATKYRGQGGRTLSILICVSSLATPPLAVVAGDTFDIGISQTEALARMVSAASTWFSIEDVSGDY